jgi:ribosomal protein L9
MPSRQHHHGSPTEGIGRIKSSYHHTSENSFVQPHSPPHKMRFHLLILSLVVSSAVAGSRTNKASFVPPASPSLTSSRAPTAAVASGYGLYASDNTKLFASKKKASAATPKKMQVKLLKHIAGTGQAGDVILVTPAFFNNKLRPTKSAELISDAAVEMEEKEKKAHDNALNAAAKEVQSDMEGFTVQITKKAGPDGQLFGGIGPKILMEELSKQLPKDLWSEKGVKLSAIMDEDGKKMKGDIKHTGKFSASVSLTHEITGSFEVSIDAL